MKESTSSLLAEVCDEFIFYEDLTRSAGIPDFSQKVPKEKQPCYQLLFETIDALQRESDSFILASRLKDTMRRKRPQFSEGSFGTVPSRRLSRGGKTWLYSTYTTDPNERNRRGRRLPRVARVKERRLGEWRGEEQQDDERGGRGRPG